MDYIKVSLWNDGRLTEEPEINNIGYNNDVFHHYSPGGKTNYFVVYHKSKVKQGRKKLFSYLKKELKDKIEPLQKQLETIKKLENE